MLNQESSPAEVMEDGHSNRIDMAATDLAIDIAPLIEHALLNPTATQEYLEQWCEEADRFQFTNVCVYPMQVRQAATLLQGKRSQVCAVIGFPTGASTAATKLYEAQEAVENGARELDVMINLSWLKAEQLDAMHRELAEICEETGVPIKAILEMGLLTDREKRLAAEVCMDAGVQFLKTNTGWFGGVTVEDVQLLRQITHGRVGIKAAGGIHTLDQVADLVLAGATRLGTSRGPDLVRQQGTLEKGSVASQEIDGST